MAWSWIADPETWVALVTLIVLELVLGVDNVIFISILSGKLPPEEQPRARTTGILLAVITRILLLTFLYVIIGLTEPLFTIPIVEVEITGKSLVLLAGGLFLLWKSTHEIHEKLEGEQGRASTKVAATFASVIIQIMLLDIVFSLDSVITAVGMVKHIEIMVMAVILAAIAMIFVAGPVSEFVERHPTVKMLALSFLLLIGFTLVAEAFHVEIPKGYIYFAMAFSVFVEILNLRVRGGTSPVRLRKPYARENKLELQPVPVARESMTSSAASVEESVRKTAGKSAAKKPKVKPAAKKPAAKRKRPLG
ncbi:MAG: TerC family protein [Anaerolineales bacterium]|nr:TerC family protein [Anaerolineales bacterium]MCZ2288705.1 TerC family protein [Anaerolineales bacterium]